MVKAGALIFDVDGTLAETEDTHRIAFNQAFAEAGLDWDWTRELYGRLLKVSGGRERMTAYARERGTEGLDIDAIQARKTQIYDDEVKAGAVTLRPGVEALMRAARAEGVRLAIATTTTRASLVSLITATLGEDALGWFAAIKTGEDVTRKKPDPEVYLLALSALGLPPDQCIAFEDTSNGVQAARGAGLRVVVTPSMFSKGEDFTGAAIVLPNLADIAPLALLNGQFSTAA